MKKAYEKPSARTKRNKKMKAPFYFAICVSLLTANTGYAQETTTASDEMYRKVTTQLEGAVTAQDGTQSDIELRYFVSETGNIINLELAAIGPKAGSYCDPICFTKKGPPEKRICIVEEGCGSGGGGAPVLLTTGPLLLEITNEDGDLGDLNLSFGLQQMGQSTSMNFTTTIQPAQE